MRIPFGIGVSMLTLGLAACATLSPDGGESAVRAATAERLGPAISVAGTGESLDQRREELLSRELDGDSAVTLAMLNSPVLQRMFADLSLNEAEIVAASRLPNPRLSLARLRQGSDRESDRAVSLDLISLLTTPLRASLGKRETLAARLAAEQSVLSLAGETRLAYVEAVTARQRAAYAADILIAAEAGRTLAQRMAEAGNISRLDAAREQAFHAEAVARKARADREAVSAHEALVRLLGVSDPARVRLPNSLPLLPTTPRDLADAEQQALDRRLDVQRARQDAANTARALRLTRVTRFINVLELGYQDNRVSGQPDQRGVEVSLELPLFDFGRTRVAGAEAVYRRALADVAATAVNARSEAREAYGAYRTAYDLARHYRDEVVPLQRQIADETMLRYNGMLISPFDLLAQSREQIAASESALDALRDFWRADAILAATLQGPMTTMTAGAKP
ncbi:MAG TPA: TolC family protein [Fluviicoccus sp.]|nr:TolC family protein [Fluviicoccus sp.]